MDVIIKGLALRGREKDRTVVCRLQTSQKVVANKIEAIQTAQNLQHLEAGKSADLWCACAGCKRRIDKINVEGQIDPLRHAILDQEPSVIRAYFCGQIPEDFSQFNLPNETFL